MSEIQLDDSQVQACELCLDLTKRIVGVTGPAGSGKTTILKRVYTQTAAAGYQTALVAPTGKAAKRIKEATGIDAMTIHRLLEYPRPGEIDEKTGKALDSTFPKRNRQNPLDHYVVYVDEAAMASHELYRGIIDALPRGGCIRMFGDVNQLKPIEKTTAMKKQATPFEKVLKEQPSVRLSTIHRQAEDSAVLSAANRLVKGVMPPHRSEDLMFQILVTDRPVDKLLKYCEVAAQNDVHFHHIEHQIITPSNKSWIGTVKLNAVLQSHFHPYALEEGIKLPRHKWVKDQKVYVAEGEKVVWTNNVYDMRSVPERFLDAEMRQYVPPPESCTIFNGETGLVESIVHEEYDQVLENGQEMQMPVGSIILNLGDRKVYVPSQVLHENKRGDLVTFDPRVDIDHAYALTTHKCQGSEFESVVYVLNKSVSGTITRRNFYTAVTRARTRAAVITDTPTLQLAVNRLDTNW